MLSSFCLLAALRSSKQWRLRPRKSQQRRSRWSGKIKNSVAAEKKPKAEKRFPSEDSAAEEKKKAKKGIEKVTQEASRLARYNKKLTITSREIQTSVHLDFSSGIYVFSDGIVRQ
ncbi:hypothetical protein J5N97_023630 [Dioscorea zingiberensis]|uniref:Uncharacterized protein n=1 Tax=Dioscorea zingiberensis TaxID=325984 RepID=A0A9D5C5F5_9LILI|nr:hypothetical protein J5N97_023630 [Dioscorea zingiberensis]